MIACILLGLCCKKTPCPTCPTTTDTTLHDWVFDPPVLFGESGSSTLYDVAIINDTLAYAVGAVYMRDSSGKTDPLPYNLAKWDGHAWQLLRIQFYTICGQSTTGSYPAKAIIAFSLTEIFISDGAQFTSWDGNQQGQITCLPVSVNRMWGRDKHCIYTVGNGGNIGFFDGSTWTKIESGTTLDIYDIYGAYNPYSLLKWEILAVASSYTPSRQERKLLQIYPLTNGVSQLDTSGLAIDLESVWFIPNQHYYVVGDGIYEKDLLTNSGWTVHLLDITQYFTTRVRGNAGNDVFIVGAFGECLHWNGSTWKSFRSEAGLSSGAYGAVAIKNNLMIAVGYDSPRAVITIGRR
jgi:hypothetical protein